MEISRRALSKLAGAAAVGLLWPGNRANATAHPVAPPFRFPRQVDGYHVLTADLHQHTLFSDGFVWPNIRVEEAARDGVDVISMTEHIEYQPRSADIAHPDRNRSFEIAREAARAQENPIIVLNGAEITRDEFPPGHINAVFLKDVNRLRSQDIHAQLEEAHRQGAFVFLNHPSYLRQRPSGMAALTAMHRDLIARGLLQGIEVGTDITVSIEAFDLALTENLAILSNSDIHTLMDWKFPEQSTNFRPATLILSAGRSEADVRDALLDRRTVAIAGGSLFGRDRHLRPLLQSMLATRVIGFYQQSSALRVTLTNISSQNLILMNTSSRSLHLHAGPIQIDAGAEVEIWIKDAPDREDFEMTFDVANAFVGPNLPCSIAFRFRGERSAA